MRGGDRPSASLLLFSLGLVLVYFTSGSTVGLVEGQVLEISNTPLLLTLYASEIFNSQMNNNLVVVFPPKEKKITWLWLDLPSAWQRPAENLVHRQAVGVERDPGAEPGLRVLPGELRRDPERRAVLLPGQPRVPRRRRHEPLLRLQRQALVELLLQQLRARRAVRSKYHTKPQSSLCSEILRPCVSDRMSLARFAGYGSCTYY